MTRCEILLLKRWQDNQDFGDLPFPKIPGYPAVN